MIDRYGICTVGEMYKEDCGEWVLYEDAAARIGELEAALRQMASLYGALEDANKKGED